MTNPNCTTIGLTMALRPLMDRFGVPATTRASLAFYNTTGEIDALVKGIHKVKELMG